MPRGNDSAAAVADLVTKGGVSTNVELLIDAQRQPPDVVAASLRSIDAEKTAQLDLSEAKVPKGHKVLSGAVRGNATVYVVEGEGGRTYKIADYANEADRPQMSPADQAAAARADAEANAAAEIARIRAEAAQKVEEARRQADADAAEEIQKIREDASEQLAEAAEEAAEAEEQAAEGAGEMTGTTDSSQGGGPKRAGKDTSDKATSKKG